MGSCETRHTWAGRDMRVCDSRRERGGGSYYLGPEWPESHQRRGCITGASTVPAYMCALPPHPLIRRLTTKATLSVHDIKRDLVETVPRNLGPANVLTRITGNHQTLRFGGLKETCDHLAVAERRLAILSSSPHTTKSHSWHTLDTWSVLLIRFCFDFFVLMGASIIIAAQP